MIRFPPIKNFISTGEEDPGQKQRVVFAGSAVKKNFTKRRVKQARKTLPKNIVMGVTIIPIGRKMDFTPLRQNGALVEKLVEELWGRLVSASRHLCVLIGADQSWTLTFPQRLGDRIPAFLMKG